MQLSDKEALKMSVVLPPFLISFNGSYFLYRHFL